MFVLTELQEKKELYKGKLVGLNMKRLRNLRRTVCRPIMPMRQGAFGDYFGELISVTLRDSPIPFHAWLTNKDYCDLGRDILPCNATGLLVITVILKLRIAKVCQLLSYKSPPYTALLI